MKKETIPPLKIEMPSESREEKEERKRREKASSSESFIALKNEVYGKGVYNVQRLIFGKTRYNA